MKHTEDVKALLDGCVFAPACTSEDLRVAEEQLGERLPEELRQLYRTFNGFRDPTNATYLWPLLASSPGDAGLVDMNILLRADPTFPIRFTSTCLFFGDDGCGAFWGYHDAQPNTIIRWDAEWGEEFEVAGTTPVSVWTTRLQEVRELE